MALNTLHIALREGFQGQTVVITVDGREVYRRSGVTTHRESEETDGVDVAVASDIARIAVFVTPGNLAGTMVFDVSRHPRVAINLVGEGTIGFETCRRLY